MTFVCLSVCVSVCVFSVFLCVFQDCGPCVRGRRLLLHLHRAVERV